MWREVTKTVCQAPCHTHPRLAMPFHLRRTIAFISVLAIPCAPLGSPSPTSYAALPNHTIVLLVLPFPRIQHNGTVFRPAPSLALAFSALFRTSAATSDERAPEGQFRGYHHTIHSYPFILDGVPLHPMPRLIHPLNLHIYECTRWRTEPFKRRTTVFGDVKGDAKLG